MSIVGTFAKRYLPDFGALAGAARVSQPETDAVAEGARAFAPVIWLIGKVQSGKSSIVRAITRATTRRSAAASGRAPARRASSIFPRRRPSCASSIRAGLAKPLRPGRGLGVLRRERPSGACVPCAPWTRSRAPSFEPCTVRRRASRLARDRRADQPARGLCAGTEPSCLYPFNTSEPEPASSAGLPADLMRSLAHQRSLVRRLDGTGPLSLCPSTSPRRATAYTPVDFGLDALAEAIVRVAPAAMVAALEAMPGFARDPRRSSRSAHYGPRRGGRRRRPCAGRGRAGRIRRSRHGCCSALPPSTASAGTAAPSAISAAALGSGVASASLPDRASANS